MRSSLASAALSRSSSSFTVGGRGFNGSVSNRLIGGRGSVEGRDRSVPRLCDRVVVVVVGEGGGNTERVDVDVLEDRDDVLGDLEFEKAVIVDDPADDDASDRGFDREDSEVLGQ